MKQKVVSCGYGGGANGGGESCCSWLPPGQDRLDVLDGGGGQGGGGGQDGGSCWVDDDNVRGEREGRYNKSPNTARAAAATNNKTGVDRPASMAGWGGGGDKLVGGGLLSSTHLLLIGCLKLLKTRTFFYSACLAHALARIISIRPSSPPFFFRSLVLSLLSAPTGYPQLEECLTPHPHLPPRSPPA